MLKLESSGRNDVIAADALAPNPCDARSSAAMILTMEDEWVPVFHEEEFKLNNPSLIPNVMTWQKFEIALIVPKMNSMLQHLTCQKSKPLPESLIT